MAIAASSVLPSNSLEEFRIEFNNLVSDVTGITSTNTFSTAIVFEGSTADAYETTLTLTDPTADRTITLPNVTGNVTVSGNPVSADGEALGSASLEWSDLYIADGGVIYFGDDQDVTITHDPDDGLFFKSIATADNNPLLLTLQTGETYMVADEPIVQIHFQVPDEASGTDAILVCAGIEAVAEGSFSSSSNATKLSFLTASSETAAEKMSLSSAGLLTVSGRIITDDATDATSTTDGSLQTDGGLSVVKDAVFGDDVKLLSDSAVLNFGADSDVTITHAHNASLTIAGGTAAQLIMSTGSILPKTDTDTSNTGSVTLNFQTNQNFVLTFTGNVTLANPSTETAGQSGVIVCIQDGTGSRTLSLGTDYETAAGAGITLSTAANAVDVIPYFVKAAGSIQLGAVQKAFS